MPSVLQEKPTLASLVRDEFPQGTADSQHAPEELWVHDELAVAFALEKALQCRRIFGIIAQLNERVHPESVSFPFLGCGS